MATLTVGSGKMYSTIQSAIYAANDNPASRAAMDIIVVDAGTYTESLDFQSLSGGWQIPCIVRAADPSNKPVIASTGGSQACLGGGAYRGSAGGETTLENLVFSGWTAATNAVCYFAGALGLVIDRCEFIGNTGRFCIRWCSATGSRLGAIKRCEFVTSGISGVGAAGIMLAYGTNTVIANNVAVCPANVQFLNESIGGPGLVAHNSIYGTWSTGRVIQLVGTARANVIQNVGAGGTNAINATGGTYTENLAFGTWATTYVGTDGGGNDTGLDPQFTNPGAYDLTTPSSSPCFRSVARDPSVLDTYDGALRSDPTDKGAFETIASTTVGSVTVISSTSIKLNLDDSVTSDSTWTDAANYTITPSGGAVAVTVASAAITDAGMSITLTTSEHTNGGAYNVAWAGVTNVVNDNDSYTGTSTPPVVSSASMTEGKTIRVTFSKSMTNNADLTTVGNYLISGMVVSGVVRVDATRVDVTMTERIPAASAIISVNGPQDLALNPVANSTANFAVPYLTFVPGGTATNEGRSVAVAFNLAPTGGVSSPSDWTVTKTGDKGADVKVTGVVMASANAALTVHPGMTRGVAYTITAPGAVNAQGGLG